MEPDSKDLAILKMLDSNARARLSEIGKACRLSKGAVSQRVRRLEEEGIIEGYYAVIDSSRLGYISFRIYLKLYRASPKREEEITSFLMKNKKVWWLGRISGKWDIGFLVWVKDFHELCSFWLSFLLKFRKNTGEYAIHPYLKLRHYTLDYLKVDMESKREAGIIGEGEKTEIDETDRKVLKTISENARDEISTLAGKSNLKPTVFKYRLKQLMKEEIIQSLRAKINTAMLGYLLYKVEFSLDSLPRLPELKSLAESSPNLIYIDETIGGGDFEAEFNFKSSQELEELIKRIKEEFHRGIRQTDYITYSKILKYSYFPD